MIFLFLINSLILKTVENINNQINPLIHHLQNILSKKISITFNIKT